MNSTVPTRSSISVSSARPRLTSPESVSYAMLFKHPVIQSDHADRRAVTVVSGQLQQRRLGQRPVPEIERERHLFAQIAVLCLGAACQQDIDVNDRRVAAARSVQVKEGRACPRGPRFRAGSLRAERGEDFGLLLGG